MLKSKAIYENNLKSGRTFSPEKNSKTKIIEEFCNLNAENSEFESEHARKTKFRFVKIFPFNFCYFLLLKVQIFRRRV